LATACTGAVLFAIAQPPDKEPPIELLNDLVPAEGIVN
jgi:hypothetical protein